MKNLIWFYKFDVKNTFETPFTIGDDKIKSIVVMKGTFPCKKTDDCLRIKMIDIDNCIESYYLYLSKNIRIDIKDMIAVDETDEMDYTVIIPQDLAGCGEKGLMKYKCKNKQELILNPKCVSFTSIFSLVITKGMAKDNGEIIYDESYVPY